MSDFPRTALGRTGQTVEAGVGESVALEFPISIGTGHKWIVADPVPPCLHFIKSEFLEPGDGMPAASKRQRLTFEMPDHGEGTLNLIYRRPFEDAKAQDPRIELKIICK